LSVFFSIDLCQISSLVKYRRKKQQTDSCSSTNS